MPQVCQCHVTGTIKISYLLGGGGGVADKRAAPDKWDWSGVSVLHVIRVSIATVDTLSNSSNMVSYIKLAHLILTCK